MPVSTGLTGWALTLFWTWWCSAEPAPSPSPRSTNPVRTSAHECYKNAEFSEFNANVILLYGQNNILCCSTHGLLASQLTLPFCFLFRRETVSSEAQCRRGVCGQPGQAEVCQRKPENLRDQAQHAEGAHTNI